MTGKLFGTCAYNSPLFPLQDENDCRRLGYSITVAVENRGRPPGRPPTKPQTFLPVPYTFVAWHFICSKLKTKQKDYH